MLDKKVQPLKYSYFSKKNKLDILCILLPEDIGLTFYFPGNGLTFHAN